MNLELTERLLNKTCAYYFVMVTRYFLSDEDIDKLSGFSRDVVSKGQNPKSFLSQTRTTEQQEIDSFRGKAVEIILCRILDEKNIYHSDIDWEVGKGAFGLTRDSGVDIFVGSSKISINATGPKDRLLLIPIYKFNAHENIGVTHLVLGTVPKENPKYVDMDGFISLYEFKMRKTLFEKNGYLGLYTNNYGILKTELYDNWNIFKGISLQEFLLLPSKNV